MKNFTNYLCAATALLLSTQASALTGDVNLDGYTDTIYVEGEYVKIKDGRSPSIITSHHVGRQTMTLHSLQQLDNDSAYEIVVTTTSSYVFVVDSNTSSASRYSIYRNGSTGNSNYQIRTIAPFMANSTNQLIVMYPGDNYVWVLDHVGKTQRNYLVTANPTTFDLVEVDGTAGLDIVLSYAEAGSITIISSNQQRSPAIREYHKNWGTSSTRDKFFGFANTDSGAAMEIILHNNTGGSSIHIIRDSAGVWGYGEERMFNLYGQYQIINANKNRDGSPGNEVCYRQTNSGKYYFLNANSGNVTNTANCN